LLVSKLRDWVLNSRSSVAETLWDARVGGLFAQAAASVSTTAASTIWNFFMMKIRFMAGHRIYEIARTFLVFSQRRCRRKCA
jgi:hypothetical protein